MYLDEFWLLNLLEEMQVYWKMIYNQNLGYKIWDYFIFTLWLKLLHSVKKLRYKLNSACFIYGNLKFHSLRNVPKDDCRDQHVPAVFGHHLLTLCLYIIQIVSSSLNLSTRIIVKYHGKYFLLHNVSNLTVLSFWQW